MVDLLGIGRWWGRESIEDVGAAARRMVVGKPGLKHVCEMLVARAASGAA
jgi:hypothetical protein